MALTTAAVTAGVIAALTGVDMGIVAEAAGQFAVAEAMAETAVADSRLF